MQFCKVVTVATLLLTPAALLAADANGTFDKTIHVNGTANLSVNTGSGYIHVSPGSDSSIHIIGHVHAGKWSGWGNGGSSPEERVKEVVDNPPIEQAGNIVDIGKHTNYKNVSIDYEITAPKGTDLTANSGSGDLRISDLNGPARLNTGSGSIEASGLSGHITLETGSGDIQAEMLSSSGVKAQTGSGSIRLKNVQGELYSETGSGDMEIQGQPTAAWKLETGSGSITLNTGNSHFSLDAQTGSGSVHSDPPLTTHGSLEHHHVTGDINGGGPMVRIQTGSGDIRIH
jgi:putative adhesin